MNDLKKQCFNLTAFSPLGEQMPTQEKKKKKQCSGFDILLAGSFDCVN